VIPDDRRGGDRDGVRLHGNGLANTLTSGDGNDFLFGLDGRDTLYGNNGDDTLDGGTGDDYMAGGQGHDTYHVDSLRDTVVENKDEGIDAVYVSVDGYTLPPNVEFGVVAPKDPSTGMYLFGNEENNNLRGASGNDHLFGFVGQDFLAGGEGNDYLDGGTGADSMWGGAGNDSYVVDNLDTPVFGRGGIERGHGDLVTELPDQGTDTIYVHVSSYALPDNIENGTVGLVGGAALYGNSAANELTGNAGRDTLMGGGDRDRLFGNGDTDYLDGGAGGDWLVGGGGNDIFVLRRGEAGGDTIVDFTGNGAAAGDSIYFDGYGAGAYLTHSGVNYAIHTADGTVADTFSMLTTLHPSDYFFV
jgi:Ca2+-binding RTX toxin-like protein